MKNMKQIKSFLVLTMMSMVNCFAQTTISNDYYIDIDSAYVSCGIEFYQDNSYVITFAYSVTDDLFDFLTISEGGYKIIDSTIILTDSLCGFDITFGMKGNDIYPIKTFDFIKKNKIKYSGKTEGDHFNNLYSEYFVNYNIVVDSKIKNYVEKEPEYYELKTGTYLNYDYLDFYFIGGYYLTIYDNGYYVYRFKNAVISRGVWNKYGNLLELNDIDLSYKFNMMIADGKLITGRIIGDYGHILKYVTPEELKNEKAKQENRMRIIRDTSRGFLDSCDYDLYVVVEQMPEFPGGIGKMQEFIRNNTKYPDEANKYDIHGKVFVKFVVERDGSLTNFNVIRGLGYGCDEEAIRVISIMPKWNPGKHKGELARVEYLVSIVF